MDKPDSGRFKFLQNLAAETGMEFLAPIQCNDSLSDRTSMITLHGRKNIHPRFTKSLPANKVVIPGYSYLSTALDRIRTGELMNKRLAV
jgi:hypothetical protein